MNCTTAREVLNSVLDGEEHPDLEEALNHNKECKQCDIWYKEMKSVLGILESSRDCVPEIDLADIVNARLTKKNPLRRLAAVTVFAWLAGLFILAAVVFGFSRSMNLDSIIISSINSYDFLKTGLISILGVVFSITRALGTAFWEIYKNNEFRTVFVRFVALDSLFLLLSAFIWRRRKQTSISLNLVA